MRKMTPFLIFTILLLIAGTVHAEPRKYVVDLNLVMEGKFPKSVVEFDDFEILTPGGERKKIKADELVELDWSGDIYTANMKDGSSIRGQVQLQGMKFKTWMGEIYVKYGRFGVNQLAEFKIRRATKNFDPTKRLQPEKSDCKTYIVDAQLKGGNRMPNSELELDDFEIVTKLGRTKVNVAEIETISGGFMGNRYCVKFLDGREANGVIQVAQYKLKTKMGELNVPMNKISKISFIRRKDVPEGSKVPMYFGELTKGVSFRKDIPKLDEPPLPAASMSRDGKLIGITLPDKEEVAIYDTSTKKFKTVKVGKEPSHIFFKDNQALVANYGSGNISVIDLGSYEVTKTFAVKPAPFWIASPPHADWFYISCPIDKTKGEIHRIDMKTWSDKGALDFPKDRFMGSIGSVGYINVTDDGSFLYVQMWAEDRSQAVPRMYIMKDCDTIACYGGTGERLYHPPLVIDWACNRAYGGRRVRALNLGSEVHAPRDMRRRAMSSRRILSSDRNHCVPHPGLAVIFNRVSEEKRYGSNYNKKKLLWEVHAVDHDTLTPTCFFELGDVEPKFLFPGEKTLYVVGGRSVYEVSYDELLTGEQLKKTKKQVIAYDRRKPPTKEDIAKAEKLIADARKKKLKGAEAKKLLEDAQKTDPLSGAAILLAEIELNDGDAAAALKRAQELSQFSFRRFDLMARCRELVAMCYEKLEDHSRAAEAYRKALQLDPENFKLRERIGDTYKESGRTYLAYMEYLRCKKEGSKSRTLSKKMSECMRALKKDVSTCPVCRGVGKEETWIERGGKKVKATRKCRTCRGKKKVWKKPCEKCCGRGCKRCNDKGYTLEPK